MAAIMKQKGFTLIELMVTVAVVAILIGIAAPSFTESIKRSKMKRTADQVQSLINLARAEAISRRSFVTVSGLNSSEISVFVDANGNGTNNTSTDTVVKKLSLAAHSDLVSTAPVSITFNANGANHSGGTATVVLCDADNKFKKRVITVTAIGRVNYNLSTDQCS